MSRRVRALSSRSFAWADLDPDRRNAVLIVGGIGIVVLFALALVGYGYYHDKIAPKHATVLKVGDRQFSYAALEKRTRAEFSPGAGDAQKAIANTLANMEREEIVRRAAKSLGVKPTEAEIQAGLADKLGIAPDTPRENIAAFLRVQLINSHMSLAEYREIVTARVLEKKLSAQFESIVPTRAEHVNLSLIETPSQVQAIQAKQKIDAGEPFSAVAVNSSTHPSKAQAGDMGWRPRGSLDPKLEEFAFKQTGISEIIETDDGFFIVQAKGQETGDVTEEGKQQIIDFALSDLLSKTKKDVKTERLLNAGQAQRLAASLGISSRA